MLRLSADLIGQEAKGQDHHGQPRAVSSRGEHAELPRHQDGDRVMRHLHGSAAQYQFDKIFPGCRLLDIHEYLLEKGVKLEVPKGVRYMFHDPCHSPMKTYQPIKVVNRLMGQDVALNDRCCGESGTLAVTRPRHLDTGAFPQAGGDGKRCRGTARRSLHRAGEDTHLLSVMPAAGCRGTTTTPEPRPTTSWWRWRNTCLGENWMGEYVTKANSGGIERVLL